MEKEKPCPYLKIAQEDQIPSAICTDTGLSLAMHSEPARRRKCRYAHLTDSHCRVLSDVAIEKKPVIRLTDEAKEVIVYVESFKE